MTAYYKILPEPSKQFRLTRFHAREHANTLVGTVEITEGIDAALSDDTGTYFGGVARTYTLAICGQAVRHSNMPETVSKISTHSTFRVDFSIPPLIPPRSQLLTLCLVLSKMIRASSRYVDKVPKKKTVDKKLDDRFQLTSSAWEESAELFTGLGLRMYKYFEVRERRSSTLELFCWQSIRERRLNRHPVCYI